MELVESLGKRWRARGSQRHVALYWFLGGVSNWKQIYPSNHAAAESGIMQMRGEGRSQCPRPEGGGGGASPHDWFSKIDTDICKKNCKADWMCVCVSFPVLELKPGANGKRPGRRNRREGRGAGLRDGRRGKRNCLKWNKWNPHYHKSIQSIIYLFLFFFSLFFFKCLLPYSFFFLSGKYNLKIEGRIENVIRVNPSPRGRGIGGRGRSIIQEIQIIRNLSDNCPKIKSNQW